MNNINIKPHYYILGSDYYTQKNLFHRKYFFHEEIK